MTNALIEATLERVAVSASDFDQRCFERFFQMSEEGKSLMAHMDHVHRGKMMAEIYRLLLADKLEDEADYLNWEAKNHETAYFCLLYTSPSPRDGLLSRMPSSA